MIDLLDNNFELLGHQYTQEEASTVSFSLGLYATQLAAGRIIDNPLDNPIAVQALDATVQLKHEIESGLRVVAPNTHEAVGTIYLPYLVRMHEGLTPARYQITCDILGVRPFELFWNALVARQLLDGANSDMSILA